MELYWLSNQLCMFACLIVWKVIRAQNGGKCSGEYSHEGSFKAGNITYVCTTSSTSGYTDVVYMDMARVQRFEVSTCSCNVVFAETGTHDIKLDYKYDKSPDNSLIVEGFSTTFTNEHETKNVQISTQENSLLFKVNATRRISACLRVSLRGKDQGHRSLFQVNCFKSEDSSQDPPPSTTIRTDQTPKITTRKSTGDEITRSGSGSTSLQAQNRTEGLPTSGNSGVVIGAAAGGAAVFIVIVVVIIVFVVKRKSKPKTSKEEGEEDYYITENATYGGVPKQPNQESMENYDEINPNNLKHQSVIYSIVDKDAIGNKNDGKDEQQTVVEDEYNHLNALPKSVVTGNIYSSIGRRGSQPTANIYNSVSASQKGFGGKDNIYNTSGVS